MEKIIRGPTDIAYFEMAQRKKESIIFLLKEEKEWSISFFPLVIRERGDGAVFFRGKVEGRYVHGHFYCAEQEGELKDGYWGD